MSDPSDPPPSQENQEQTRVIEPTDADKPFDSSAKADAILRSSDTIDFFVLKGFLSFASSVFDSMFSLDQGDVQDSKDTSKNGLPIVPLAEDSATLYSLLVLVYPYANKPDICPGDYIKLARAARKYAMDEAEQTLRNLFATSSIFQAEPLRAFAIAVHLGWPKEAENAAWITLARRQETLGRCDELGLITAADYVELWEWRSRCQKAAEEAVYEVCRGERIYSLGSQSSLASTLSSLAIATIREAILEQLRKKKCPRRVVVNNETIANIFDRLGSENISGFKHILDACNLIAAKIDDAAFKIPFKQLAQPSGGGNT
ncbi:hypothetical protein M378DRAFT_119119 [Amanita muscaria Koide BX008]|uniref:BTB domain-containing protein n=1 Tax=Amanita muscaria (strain Koide BX008) TaxID=946122 RepID=A0A0C2X4N5_AMAMK|nr:hypothetical protein M378DRAFT_119119 [Amanita muscaria Koide BX008]